MFSQGLGLFPALALGVGEDGCRLIQTLFLDGWQYHSLVQKDEQVWVGEDMFRFGHSGGVRRRERQQEMKNQILGSVSTEKTVKDG